MVPSDLVGLKVCQGNRQVSMQCYLSDQGHERGCSSRHFVRKECIFPFFHEEEVPLKDSVSIMLSSVAQE